MINFRFLSFARSKLLRILEGNSAISLSWSAGLSVGCLVVDNTENELAPVETNASPIAVGEIRDGSGQKSVEWWVIPHVSEDVLELTSTEVLTAKVVSGLSSNLRRNVTDETRDESDIGDSVVEGHQELSLFALIELCGDIQANLLKIVPELNSVELFAWVLVEVSGDNNLLASLDARSVAWGSLISWVILEW